MNTVLEQLGLTGIVPVVVITNAGDAGPLADALLEGGLNAIEVTFRTPAARDAIVAIARAHPDMLLGAGTVLTIDQVQAAVDAGAKYIVSPGLNRKVVEHCLAKGIPVTPGVATPSEVEAALELGLEVIKFFPAEAGGGLQFLKAIAAPYRGVRFIPTGGIDETNLLPYLKFPQVLACGGSWMAKPELIASGKFDEIRRLTAQAVNLMLGFELKHVGVNTPDPVSAQVVADALVSAFHMPMKDGNSSIFVGGQFEVMKKNFLGAHGHLAIGTHSINRAVAYLERRGFAIKPETRNEKDGKLLSVYLDRTIGGFAFHLLQL